MIITFLGRSTTVANSDDLGSSCCCNLWITLYVLGGRNCSRRDCFFVDPDALLTSNWVSNTSCCVTSNCCGCITDKSCSCKRLLSASALHIGRTLFNGFSKSVSSVSRSIPIGTSPPSSSSAASRSFSTTSFFKGIRFSVISFSGVLMISDPSGASAMGFCHFSSSFFRSSSSSLFLFFSASSFSRSSVLT